MHLFCGACIAEKLGSLWGDQNEYLLCERCDYKCDWDDMAPDKCPRCAETLVVHVPHSQELEIRYATWRYNQQWLPQRFYCVPSDGSGYRYWQWLGRQWRKRPADPLSVA